MKAKRPPTDRRLALGDGFKAAFRKLDPALQEETLEAIRKFRNRSAESSLQPEKKSGLKGIWAFRVNQAIRVFYVQRQNANGAYSELFHVGPHDDYRTILNKKPADIRPSRVARRPR
jgi:hypothetical protein